MAGCGPAFIGFIFNLLSQNYLHRNKYLLIGILNKNTLEIIKIISVFAFDLCYKRNFSFEKVNK